MQKLIAAFAAILVTGVVGAFSVPANEAQDSRRERTRSVEVETGEILEVETGNGRIVEVEIVREEGDRLIQRVPNRTRQAEPQAPGFAIMRSAPGQPGTWQTVTHDDALILLNTATGETFMLDANDDGAFWRAIPRPGMGPRTAPHGMPDMPRMPGMDRPDADRPNREQLEQKLEQLRKRLKESEGERREQVKRAIEELENALGKFGKRDREDNDGADRERLRDELKNRINELEEKIGSLKEKAADTDSKRESRKFEEQIGELKEKIKALSKELKELKD